MSNRADVPASLREGLLLAAEKIGERQIWINRDAHVLLTRHTAKLAGVVNMFTTIDVFPEEPTGTYTSYLVPLSLRRPVIRTVEPLGPASWWDVGRLAKSTATGRVRADAGNGLYDADPDDIRQLLGWLDGAELIAKSI